MELIEFILWQKCCYEMDNDYWQYSEGKCSKCGSHELYIKEVPSEDFANQVICKMCGTEFVREQNQGVMPVYAFMESRMLKILNIKD